MKRLSPSSKWRYFVPVVAGLCYVNFLALAQDTTSSTRNLIVNGTFEKGIDGWVFDAYDKKGVMALDATEKHGTHPSVRIDNAVADDSHLKQKVTVEPGTRYRLEAYIKTKDVQSVTRDGKGGACIDLDGTWQRSLPAINKTKSWTRVTKEIITGTETEVEVDGRLGFWSDGVTGTAWFADFSLVRIGKAPPQR